MEGVVSVRVLAIDPGVTTGFAMVDFLREGPVVDYRQDKLTPREFGDFALALNANHYICESFQHRSGEFHKDVLFPVELIGVLKYVLDEDSREVQLLWFQPPATQGKKTAFFTDEKIKDMGLWKPGLDHGRSALKHLLHWFRFGFGACIPQAKINFVLGNLTWESSNGTRN